MNTKVEYAIRCMQWKPTSSVLHVTEKITIEENNDIMEEINSGYDAYCWCLLFLLHRFTYLTICKNNPHMGIFYVTNLRLYSNRLPVTANLWFFNALNFNLSLSGHKNEHKIIENKCVWYGFLTFINKTYFSRNWSYCYICITFLKAFLNTSNIFLHLPSEPYCYYFIQ